MQIKSSLPILATLCTCLLLCFGSLFLSSCGGKGGETTQDSSLVQNPDSLSEDVLWDKTQPVNDDTLPLPQKILMLRDSADKAWQAMRKCEDDKFENIKSFLERIKNVDGFTDSKNINIMLKGVLAARFTKETMSNSTLVDEYDKKTEELIKAVNTLAEQTTNLPKYTAVTKIHDQIQGLDGSDLMKRAKYSSYAKQYNELWAKNKTELAGMGEPYKSLVQLPDFASTPDM